MYRRDASIGAVGSALPRRLTEQGDYVRIEIETALKAGVEIIPLLIDGAKMPSRRELPGSIAELAGRNAYELPWAAGVAKLSDRILQLEKQREAREAAERAERQRLDLRDGQGLTPSKLAKTASASFAVVARAMEISLARRGDKVCSPVPTSPTHSSRAPSVRWNQRVFSNGSCSTSSTLLA